ncbi:hypothetical protein HOLleu_23720 [Holothuria leucospilota]|uniref:Reverse transcriptase domain-containing protein n=1 Tax=Holothuria leucospilota TaxID=206669 RepID=A0A9Q1BVT2_HOLLE|nr:hypothetical protein HOLleu_23720 [Holothuria leucospilota]
MKPEKTRIVFDCASKFQNVSLNDEVYQGPDLTNKLLGVLMRFRQNHIAIMADIRAMFHQVKVSPGDQDVLRFLWWPSNDMSKQPDVYRMGVHLFGGTWSPSCCNYALQRTADDNQEDYHSETIRTVKRNFYVDDCLKSVGNVQDAERLYTELTELLSRGGFVLAKWLSNSPSLMNRIPDEHKCKSAKGVDFSYEALPVERALGICWHVEEDCFSYISLCSRTNLTQNVVY